MTQIPIHDNVVANYYKNFKRVEPIAVNSSRLNDYKKCPELYRLKHVLGYKPKEDPIYQTWGKTVHRFFQALEEIHRDRKEIPLEAVVGLASIEAMKIWGDTKDPPVEDRKFGFMTKSRLADLLMFASKVWLSEKQSGKIEVLSAEKSFTLELPTGMIISGTPDQTVRWGGNRYIRDYKTTTQEIKFFKRNLFPNDQFIRYGYGAQELGGETIFGVIIDVYFMTRDKGPTFHREIIGLSIEVLKRWVNDQEYWKKVLDVSRETDNYPQNEQQCKWCPFHKVCQSQSQIGKEYVLKTEYKFAPWDDIREGSTIFKD